MGQITSLNSGLQWFDKADQPAVDAFFTGNSYQLLDQKDSSGFHILHYSLVKTEMGVQSHTYLFLSDTAVEMLSFETYDLSDYKSITAQLKGQHFKSLGANVNGNFITTVYDNDRFLLNQDYEAVENPLGKGQISYYRYRIYRKNGQFDEMNGEKTVMFTDNGTSYPGIRENYKNGVLSGERTYYYPNGTIKRKENYQAGRLNGLASDYDTEGRLTHSVTHSYHWRYGMEKWYNNEGKVVKTLQWQRDLPVGTEKQTYNGTVVASISYVKGVKQGLAKIPIYYDGHIDAKYPLDTLNDAPLALENVNYKDGLKKGKAICVYFDSPDTMYLAHYKAGKLDSIFTRYTQNHIWYTTTFANDLENGERIFRIPSGDMKDTIYKIERYKNGKLDGKLEQFYTYKPAPVYEDSEFHLQEMMSHPIPVPEEWIPGYSFETFKDGVLNGPFSLQWDYVNSSKGSYSNGKLDGLYEDEMFTTGEQIKTIRNYNKGEKTGEWITNYVYDSVVVKENYLNGKKHGIETKTVKGQLVEERKYLSGFLTEIMTFDPGFEKYELMTNEIPNVYIIRYEQKLADTSRIQYYSAFINNYPVSDSVLVLLKSAILRSTNAIAPQLNGEFEIKTPDYSQSGFYQNGSLINSLVTTNQSAGVTETIAFLNNTEEIPHYTDYKHEPYTGTFKSILSHETISVKDGLRNGWCIQYDAAGKEIGKTKYVKGITKKTIRNNEE